ncbi:MAG: FAD-dependent monooxygenase [Chloroflexi bacterium]|nr:FAD-dependent monooxygenase [Chloroflexota bacterium]MCI0577579.1 FAD-dependent monooxygenase [Chloroflexota bacterium]MCI0644201.1 FAD-dependent monooxygenase [Chloroflexota bacterium]MCI0725216.1 FAD-dependent monooxygenase [Chloroflexota bacterium]
MDKQYDIIIIGGRVAGASLAMRLGQQNRKVLLIERITFPSWPSVPSSPIVHPGTMRLLSELGFAEEEYTYAEGKADHVIMDMMGKFQAVMPMAMMDLDRNYIYGIDRNKFDTVLWRRAASCPTVSAYENFAMTDVLKDAAGRVTGIVGRTGDRTEEVIQADLVVGADGRFSLAARKFGAEPFEELNDYPSASYHAEWEGVAEYSKACPHPLVIYQLGGGYSLLCIPIDKQKYIIANYLRTGDTHFGGKKLEEHYVQALQSVPRLREQLKNARRVTPVVGVRRIDNGYRQAYGQGWALVGDAFHYESPLDGQGIYNALLASKFLAEAIEQWKNGQPWEEAGKEYQQRFYDSSHDMLKQTVARVQQELYTSPPPFVVNTLMRWVLTDPRFQKKFLLYLSRAIDPNTFTFGPSLGPVARGFLRDVFRTGRRQPAFE